jgi:hypothetical protein
VNPWPPAVVLKDMTGGESARRDHGALEPPAHAGAIQAGLAAIARHDPGFSARTLTTRATAAVELIGQSLTSGDATPARTIMANGLYRTHHALLELRAQAQVWCEGSWHATGATVVHAASTSLFDEVRVRLRCQGWCWEWHEPTGLTLRGSPESTCWSEDLTFGRPADAIWPVAGGLPASRCPSCGAPLDLDPDGTCRHCQGVITAGRDDWVLVAWQREPR